MCSQKLCYTTTPTSTPVTNSSYTPVNKTECGIIKGMEHHHTDDKLDEEEEEELQRWPTPREAISEIFLILKISGPTTITGLLIYTRSIISILFLGRISELALAGGSLSIGFANITGYSIITGLSLGMEPICGQSYGAKQLKLLGLTLQRTILLLLTVSIPISLIWLNMNRIMLWSGQDEKIVSVAHEFLTMLIPDLFTVSILHPLRIYLRAQGVTLPLTWCTGLAVVIHLPLCYLFVECFGLGVRGVAVAMVLTNLNTCVFLCVFVWGSSVCKESWITPSLESVKGWSTLVSLAVPTCVSVCLEWWWYELMIVLCGLLPNPQATVASMGILIQTTSLVYVFPSSLSLGVSTRVGNELGANRPGKARRSMVVAVCVAVGMGFMAMVFTVVMKERWGRMFTADDEILRLTALVLPIVGVCELGNCPQTTGCGVLRGCARVRVGANINLGSFYCVGMPVAVVLGFLCGFGFAGLWIGLLAAQVCCAGVMMSVLWRTDWRVMVVKAKEITGGGGGELKTKLTTSDLKCANSNGLLLRSEDCCIGSICKDEKKNVINLERIVVENVLKDDDVEIGRRGVVVVGDDSNEGDPLLSSSSPSDLLLPL